MKIYSKKDGFSITALAIMIVIVESEFTNNDKPDDAAAVIRRYGL